MRLMTAASLRGAALAGVCLLAIGTVARAQEVQDLHFGTWGYDLSATDRSVRPGDDFYAYANGGALRAMEIPADRTSWGNFAMLGEVSESRVHVILEEAARKNAPLDTVEGKIGAFYTAYMDEPRLETLGATPLQAPLDRIRAMSSRDALARYMAGAYWGETAGLFGGYISTDPNDSSRYILQISTRGMGMPTRDYYLKPAFAETRIKYEAYVTRLLTLINWPEPEANAKAILAYETRMAEASWELAQRRDRDKTNNLMTPAELAAYAPGFDWAGYLGALELKGLDKIIVADNTAFPTKARIFAETPLETLKAWEAFAIADDASQFLSKPFVDARFEFRSKVLGGQPAQPPRWKLASRSSGMFIGEAVGQLYVKRYFTPEAKAQMQVLVDNIKTAQRRRIQRLEWMSPETKAKALEKLDLFKVKIGYPDVAKDYSALTLSPTDLYGNILRARRFEWLRGAARYDQPVDKTEWGMPPQIVNAYYNFAFNEIVFPAAILQPPFFDPKGDPAINYGGIGGVIGHEISHGFDDQGRKSDGQGRLADWWTPSDKAEFNARADRLGQQYDANHPLANKPDQHINGRLTMGENIGDMGGINLALDAYRTSLKGRKAPVLDGFTGEQRVFLGWAQVWTQKIRPDALLQQLQNDPHAPAIARVNEVMRNVDAWYAAFDVKPGDKLYLPPAERVRIW